MNTPIESNSCSTHPRPSFQKLWAQGHFDNCRFYALSAQLEKWPSEHAWHLMAARSACLPEKDRGIAVCNYTLYIYSTESLAHERAGQLGEGVTPFSVGDLLSFFTTFGQSYTFADLVLDEAWHLEAYVCRAGRSHENGAPREDITHLRASWLDGLFEYTACGKTGKAAWRPYPGYGDPASVPEPCRPIPFLRHPHPLFPSLQYRAVEIEQLTNPELLKFTRTDDYVVTGNPDLPGRLYKRPTGPLAFANNNTARPLITSGEGVFVPFASISESSGLQVMPWARGLEDSLSKYAGPSGLIGPLHLCRGAQWYVNRCVTALEKAFLPGFRIGAPPPEDLKDRILDLLWVANRQGDYDDYAVTLFWSIENIPAGELEAIAVADRIIWHGARGDLQAAAESFRRSTEISPDSLLALYNYGRLLAETGYPDKAEGLLQKLVILHDRHSPALYELGRIALGRGDTAGAEALFKKSEAVSKVNPRPSAALAGLYNLGEDFLQAMDRCEESLRRVPDNLQAIRTQVAIMEKQGFRSFRVRYLRDLLRADPLNLDTYRTVFAFTRETGHELLEAEALDKFKAVFSEAYLDRVRDVLPLETDVR